MDNSLLSYMRKVNQGRDSLAVNWIKENLGMSEDDIKKSDLRINQSANYSSGVTYYEYHINNEKLFTIREQISQGEDFKINVNQTIIA